MCIEALYAWAKEGKFVFVKTSVSVCVSHPALRSTDTKPTYHRPQKSQKSRSFNIIQVGRTIKAPSGKGEIGAMSWDQISRNPCLPLSCVLDRSAILPGVCQPNAAFSSSSIHNINRPSSSGRDFTLSLLFARETYNIFVYFARFQWPPVKGPQLVMCLIDAPAGAMSRQPEELGN